MLINKINTWIYSFFKNFLFFSTNTTLSFIVTSLLIYKLGAKDYGYFQFLFSLVAILSFSNFTDSLIERKYYSLKDINLVAIILRIKFIFYIFILILFLIINIPFQNNYNYILIYIIFSITFFDSLTSTYNFVLLTENKVSFINKITYIKNTILIIYVLSYEFLFNKSFSIEGYLYFLLTITIICFFCYVVKSNIIIASLLNPNYKFSEIFDNDNKKILIPVLFTHISGYVKTNFPTLFFGFQNEFVTATFTRVIIQMFQTLHKLLNASTSRFLAYIKKLNYINMIYKANFYNSIYLFLVIGLFIILILFSYIYTIYVIGFVPSVEDIKYIILISIAFLFLTATHKNTIFLKLNLDYSFLYFTAPGNLIFIPLVSYIFIDKGIYSISIAYISANFYMYLVVSLFAIKNKIISFKNMVFHTFIYTLSIFSLLFVVFEFINNF